MKQNTIKAVDITCEILQALRETNKAGVTELADELGYSKSTIHDHLTTLREHEHVVNQDGQYRLSLCFLDVAQHVKDTFDNYDIIETELDKLSERTDEVAQFGTVEHGKVAYVYKSKGTGAIRSASRPGKRAHLHATGLGKAILSEMSPEDVDAIIDRFGLPAVTENTIDNREDLYEELETIRNRGYAIDDEEISPGIRCIAAPVVAPDSSILGAVSVTGPVRQMDGERFEEVFPKEVMRTTNVIEVNIQHA